MDGDFEIAEGRNTCYFARRSSFSFGVKLGRFMKMCRFKKMCGRDTPCSCHDRHLLRRGRSGHARAARTDGSPAININKFFFKLLVSQATGIAVGIKVLLLSRVIAED
jgi:hypothetical protein